MGLDIYLYKYSNFEDTQKREKEYSDRTKALWTKSYDATPETEREEIREKSKEIASELMLDEWGTDIILKEKIKMDSKIHPEHYFKIGYFRSSYNGSGINRILSNLGIMNLHDIFNSGDSYEFQPDWEKSLKNTKKALSQLKYRGEYRCLSISKSIFSRGNSNCNSEGEAIKLFMEENKRKNSFGNYSNGIGHFYKEEPLKVFALIPGNNNILGKTDCTYVIFEGENKFYIEALEIIKETIEYVLSQTDRNKYYLHWSG